MTFTTAAFDRSSSWRFEASSYKAASKGPPSSLLQHDACASSWHNPLVSRVGDWRAGLGRSLCSLLARSFVCECHTISTVPRFQPPPRRTQHADFPHCALLFASPQDLWDLSCRRDFRFWSNHPVAVEQPESLVQPAPTPPHPAEALPFPGSIPRTARAFQPSP